MRKIPINQVTDALSPEERKRYAAPRIVNPELLAFIVDGDDGSTSWTQDGRESLGVSATLVCSLLRQHSHTGNVEAPSQPKSWYMMGTEKKTGVAPPVWGTLDSVSVRAMGTDAAPIFAIADTGRQQCKAAEWLTAFLSHCRDVLRECGGDTIAAQGRLMASASDEIVRSFGPAEWAVIFVLSPTLRRPLVSVSKPHGDYSGVFFVRTHPGGGSPSDRASLERAKLARQRVPSTWSGEALSLRRLVVSYLRESAGLQAAQTEETALAYARPYVQAPLAVGGVGAVTAEHVRKLYLFALVCEEVRALVDGETDPKKSIAAFERAVKKCVDISHVSEVVDGDEDRRYIVSENYLTTDEQVERYSGKPKATAPRKPKKLAKVSPAILARLDSGSAQAQTVAAYLRWQAGDAKALPADIVEALTAKEDEQAETTATRDAGQPVAQAWMAAEAAFAQLALAIEAWDGGPPRHSDAAIKAQLDEMYDALPSDCVKTADRKAWALNTWLMEKARGENKKVK